jgi:ribosomal protein L37E
MQREGRVMGQIAVHQRKQVWHCRRCQRSSWHIDGSTRAIACGSRQPTDKCSGGRPSACPPFVIPSSNSQLEGGS